MLSKSLSLVCLVAALCWASSQAAVFDGVDVPALLKNETAVAGYVKCILGSGDCNESAKRLQSIVPNALTGKCSECTEQQKAIIGTIIGKLQKSFPDQFEQLLKKYDPEGKHREDILALAKAVPTAAPAAPATTPKA